ncbi:MAG: PEP-CTERM sorting domain-containing protein [Fimbriimonadaceae bacterium]
MKKSYSLGIKPIAALSLTLFACTPALALNMTTRSTAMNWSAIYGGGPTVITPSDSFTASNLTNSFSNSMQFSDTQSGDFPGNWTASVAIDIGQFFSVIGPLTDFVYINGSQYGTKAQAATGIGSAGIQSAVPGNRMEHTFDAATAFNYNLNGNFFYEVNGAQLNAYVMMQKWNGSGFSTIWDSRLQGLGNAGSYDVTGQLTAGTYKLIAQTETPLGPTFYSVSNVFRFTNLDAVPEPATMFALGGFALVALRRRKKN